MIDDAVRAVERRNGGFELSGAFGSITADRILVSTGGFGSELFDWKLDVERRARTIVMARLADDGRIPSLILDQPPDDRVQEVYWVPPVEYPDGSVRIKIGGNMKDTIFLEPDELVDWFHGDGDPAEIDCLGNNLRALLPDAPLGDVTTQPCVITGTPTGMPYIGMVDDGIGVAIAGNGSAAKSSDELGRLGASLFGEAGWDSDSTRRSSRRSSPDQAKVRIAKAVTVTAIVVTTKRSNPSELNRLRRCSPNGTVASAGRQPSTATVQRPDNSPAMSSATS